MCRPGRDALRCNNALKQTLDGFVGADKSSCNTMEQELLQHGLRCDVCSMGLWLPMPLLLLTRITYQL
jgi:hypothetical protein